MLKALSNNLQKSTKGHGRRKQGNKDNLAGPFQGLHFINK